jgi:hypothetical protein
MDNKDLDCNDEIKALIAERMEKGKKAYGHGLMQNSGYDWVQEALEEALDLSIYLSAKLIEIKNSTSNKNAQFSSQPRETVQVERTDVSEPKP